MRTSFFISCRTNQTLMNEYMLQFNDFISSVVLNLTRSISESRICLRVEMKLLVCAIFNLLFGVCTLMAISFDKDGNAIEPSSSVLFPAHYLPSKQSLIGMTVRIKKIVFVDFQVKLYSIFLCTKTISNSKI